MFAKTKKQGKYLLKFSELLSQKQAVPGVRNQYLYFLFNEDELLYIGQSDERVFTRFHVHKKRFDFTHYTILNIPDEYDLNRAEREYILKFHPPKNKIIPETRCFNCFRIHNEKYHINPPDIRLAIKKLNIEVFINPYTNLQSIREEDYWKCVRLIYKEDLI